MPVEIERKFLVKDDRWRASARGVACRQGYLAAGPPVAVRVRIMDGKATLNIKKASLSITRDEFEYPIPLADAEHLLASLCQGYLVEKTRYRLAFQGLTWEIDAFHGHNDGLVVAEVELENAAQAVPLPPWIGEEVSGDARYLNSTLTIRPFRLWD
jgi:CYTH domain-containing protein